MSSCIEKIGHAECGSSDALQVWEDDRGGHTAYCFACDTYVADPYGDRPADFKPPAKFKKSKEEIQAELEEIIQCPVVDLPDRKLKKESLEYFNITIGVSEVDGSTPVMHHYPYYKNGEIVAAKCRMIEGKKFWSVGDIKEADLFGWSQALGTGAKALYITEGEMDAVALYQALKKKSKGTAWAHYDPAVVSLINGAAAGKRDIAKFLPAILSNFKEVVLLFDDDEAGRAAVKDVMQLIPYAKTVKLPAKDPNECLIKGFEMALCNAVLFKKEKPKNTRLVWGNELIEKARVETEWGLSYPWAGLTKKTRGIRFGETVYLGAGVKMGKTTMVNTIMAHMITEHGLKVFCVQPEEENHLTFRHVVGKVAKRVFHDPDIDFDYKAYDGAAPTVGGDILFLYLYQDLEWATLRSDIMAAVEEGCRAVFIDPITNLTNGVSSGEANTVLQEFAQELARVAKDLNIIIFLFCHLKAPHQGPPHERGGKVFSSQFAGSRAMMRSCHLMLGLEGNKDPDLLVEERNMRRLLILEDRNLGASGYVSLYYDDKTGLYHEIPEV